MKNSDLLKNFEKSSKKCKKGVDSFKVFLYYAETVPARNKVVRESR